MNSAWAEPRPPLDVRRFWEGKAPSAPIAGSGLSLKTAWAEPRRPLDVRRFWEGKALSAPVAGSGLSLKTAWTEPRPPLDVRQSWEGKALSDSHRWLRLVIENGLDGAAPSLGCSPILGVEDSVRPIAG